MVPVGARSLERVRHGLGGDRAGVHAQGIDHAADDVAADERSRRVVNENAVGRARGERLEPETHRFLARLTSDDWCRRAVPTTPAIAAR